MYRVFIRFSINGDNGSLTTCMSKMLTDSGFDKVGTGEYHNSSMTQANMGNVLGEFWRAVAHPTVAFSGTSFPPDVHIDHIWIYSGTVEKEETFDDFEVIMDLEEPSQPDKSPSQA